MDEESIFAAALGLSSPAERQAYLDQACGDRPVLRQQVEELLLADSDAGSFIARPAIAPERTVGGGTEETTPIGSQEQEISAILESCSTPNRIGKLGAYEIIEVVGSGGMGTVLRGFDVKLRRIVAVKILSPQFAANGLAVKRFLREAQSVAAVHHDHVVTIHAVEDQHRPPFLVMEFVQGRTLQQKIDEEGELELTQILRIGSQIAAGLAAAHKQGLIHRDVKPANILLENGVERVKITDFGLARAADDAAMTGTGVVAGTPQYMSPEQAKGESVDLRTDLFSLGSVLYTMCAGRPAFRAETTMGVLRRVCDESPAPLAIVNPQIPEWLTAIIARLLEKDPGKRFQTADETATLLEQCLAHVQNPRQTPLPAFAAELPGSTPAPTRRQSWIRSPALIAILFLAPLLALLVIGGDARTALLAFLQGSSDAPPAPAISPFNADQAHAHQRAWAKHLGVPVNFTNSLGMEFVLIPPGEFMMGSTNSEIESALKTADREHWWDCIRGEAPQHKVILTEPIYIAVHETTQGEYQQVMGKNPSYYSLSGEGKEAVAGLDTTGHPVECVDWNDAAEFCSTLSEREKLKPFYFRTGETTKPLDGTGYRLLTEAEWEFACRAGTTTRNWNSDKDEDVELVAWIGPNSGLRTHAVGESKPNPFGLFDVYGNVWEWVEDGWESASYSQFRERPATNPRVPTRTDTRRVLRGSSFVHLAPYCRSALRNPFDPLTRLNHVGFRVALPVEAVRQAIQDQAEKRRSAPGEVPSVANLTPRLVLKGHSSWVHTIAFSPDGKTLATGSNDQQVRLFDTAKGDLTGQFHADYGLISSVAYSPDGAFLISASNLGNVKVWDAAAFDLVAEAKHDSNVSIAFRRSDSILATAGWDKQMKLWKWDGAAHKPVRTLEEHSSAVADISFNPQGTTIASASGDGTLYLWDVGSGKQLTSVQSGRPLICLAFSPNGRIIAAGGYDKKIEIYKADTLESVGTLQGHQEWVTSLVFLADGKTLVSAGAHFDLETQKSTRPGELKLWDVADLKERLSVPGFESGVACLALSPDGQTLASGDHANLARLWDVDALLAAAGIQQTPRPILRMHFDETDFYRKGGKTYVRDRSGKGNDGLCEQVQFTPEGKTGGGLATGGKGFLRLPSSLIAGKPSFTIAGWVKPTDLNQSGCLYLVANTGYPTEALAPRFSFGYQAKTHLFANAWNDLIKEHWIPATSDVVTVLPDEWLFVAAALEEGGPGTGRLRLMLNDRVWEKSLQQIGGNHIEAYQDIVGANLEGVVDEFTVWDRALPAAELKEILARGQ